MAKFAVIFPAAGKSTRFSANKRKKPFVELKGRAIWVRSAELFVTRDDVAHMKDRSVIVDVAVDQGGSIGTCRPTTHSAPTYVEEGVVHYCVANMPGAVARTSTFALTNATLPYLRVLANDGVAGLVRAGEGPAEGINVHEGRVFHKGVAKAFGLPHSTIADLETVRRR